AGNLQTRIREFFSRNREYSRGAAKTQPNLNTRGQKRKLLRILNAAAQTRIVSVWPEFGWITECTARLRRDAEGTLIVASGNQLLSNGERVRVAFALDCCDREAMSFLAITSGVSGEDVRDLMLAAVEHRFGPVNRLPVTIEWLSDNGSCYLTAHY